MSESLEVIEARFDKVAVLDGSAMTLGAALAYSLDVPVLIAELRQARTALADTLSALVEIDTEIAQACPLWAITFPEGHTAKEVAAEANEVLDGILAVLERDIAGLSREQRSRAANSSAYSQRIPPGAADNAVDRPAHNGASPCPITSRRPAGGRPEIVQCLAYA